MERILRQAQVRQAFDFIRQDDERTFAELLELCVIPAPSHHEARRAAYIEKKFQETGLKNVHVDEVSNVFGTIPGTGTGPTIMIAAHTDTVFPETVALEVKKDEPEIYRCPGINDDTKAVTELFTIARAMTRYGLAATGDIIFCANVCEEGLGDLKGVKHIFANPNHGIDAFISVDNPVSGGIVYYGTGSYRYQVTITGPGGHSFADFGTPSPIHALGRAMAEIAAFQVPKLPKTTFNIGTIQGGTSVNVIAETASMLVDIRSDEQAQLLRLEAELYQAVEKAVTQESVRNPEKPLQAQIKKVGSRPAGRQPENCTIVRSAWEATELLGLTPELRDESSTDANIPISLGIPAITIGRGGKEGGVHTVREWHQRDQDYLAPQRDLLLLLALGGMDGVADARL